MANAATILIDPFVRIFVAPRATIRRIVDSDPHRQVILLAALGFALPVFVEAEWASALSVQTGSETNRLIGLAVGTALSAAYGVLWVYLGGALIRSSAALIGGVAAAVEVRAALGWGLVPAIFASALWFAVLVAWLLSPVAAGWVTSLRKWEAPDFICSVLGITGVLIQLQCIAEVNRFSAWRALGAVLLAGVTIIPVIGLIFMLAVLIASFY